MAEFDDIPDAVKDPEDYRMDYVKGQVFSKNGKEIVPSYLRCDLPSQKGKLAKQWVLQLHKDGNRPTADGFARVCKELYIKHCKTNGVGGKYSKQKSRKNQSRKQDSGHQSLLTSQNYASIESALREDARYKLIFGT